MGAQKTGKHGVETEPHVVTYSLRPRKVKNVPCPSLNTPTVDECHNDRKTKIQDIGSKKMKRKIEKSIPETIRKSVNKENNQYNRRSMKNSKDKAGFDKESPQNECSNEIQSKTKGRKRKVNLRRDSFEKYGVIFPSYQEVLDNKIKIMNEANALDAYEAEYGTLDNSLLFTLQNISNNLDTSAKQNLLDCKHLHDEELQEYFQRNVDFIKNIQDGNSESERHKKFQTYDPSSYFTVQDLSYSPSIVVFNNSQRDLLLKMLEDHFDPESENTEYLFKVLLPELCMKIFMDVHDMDENKAVDYLNWRPFE